MAAASEPPPFSFVELFGEKLQTKDATGEAFETVDTKERLDGKYVLVYFSAHWVRSLLSCLDQGLSWQISMNELGTVICWGDAGACSRR